MKLENQRVRLLPFSHRAAEPLREIIFDKSIWKYMGHYIKTETDFQNYIHQTLNAKKQDMAIPFLVVDKDYGALAGCTRFGKLDYENKRAEIGWTWYGTNFQGTGLNFEAKQLLLDYGFNDLGLNRIQLGTDVRNTRSQKAIEKLGAVKEGIRRSHYVDARGVARDDIYYSITKQDWSFQNTKLEKRNTNLSNLELQT